MGTKLRTRTRLRHGLKAGKLPDGARYIEYQMNALRRQLEDAVLDARGEVDIVDAANIQTAVKWERHGALALRWLRLEVDGLKPLERLHFSREIARASTERDKAIANLNLASNTVHDAWSVIDAKPKQLGSDSNNGQN